MPADSRLDSTECTEAEIDALFDRTLTDDPEDDSRWEAVNKSLIEQSLGAAPAISENA